MPIDAIERIEAGANPHVDAEVMRAVAAALDVDPSVVDEFGPSLGLGAVGQTGSGEAAKTGSGEP